MAKKNNKLTYSVSRGVSSVAPCADCEEPATNTIHLTYRSHYYCDQCIDEKVAELAAKASGE